MIFLFIIDRQSDYDELNASNNKKLSEKNNEENNKSKTSVDKVEVDDHTVDDNSNIGFCDSLRQLTYVINA